MAYPKTRTTNCQLISHRSFTRIALYLTWMSCELGSRTDEALSFEPVAQALDHARALSLIAAGMKREAIAATIECTTESLRRWYNEASGRGW